MANELLIGLEVLKNIMHKGLEEYKCDKVIAAAFNVNLDFIISLFENYPSLEIFKIYANDEYINCRDENRSKILDLIKQNKIEIRHLSSNINVIHAKGYGFYKEGKCKLMGIGSPNLSRISNQSIECIVLFSDLDENHFALKIWDQLEELSEELKIKDPEPRRLILGPDQSLLQHLNESLLEGLWEHQKAIIKWMVQRKRSIINIPPGTGKTKIGLIYLKFLKKLQPKLTTIILVPTITLLNQWKNILIENGLNVQIGETTKESLKPYIAMPEGKILLTIYSRFVDYYKFLADKIDLVTPPLLLIADECHNIYSNFEELLEFTKLISKSDYYHVGLSATIDTFEVIKKDNYINYCGGPSSVFDITLQSFYTNWNDRNDRPILKEIKYFPTYYYLTEKEFNEYNKLSKGVYIQKDKQKLNGSASQSAALKRASFVRNCKGALKELESSLGARINEINKGSVIIFVYKNEDAQRIRTFLTNHSNWNPDNSVYIYDSEQHNNYLNYAMRQFKNNKGFCLISERMLAEGFDLPKITHIALHGSYRSERDWIQKIGRAIRYDPEDPDSVAKIIDVIICNPKGDVLPLEKERFKILSSLSI